MRIGAEAAATGLHPEVVEILLAEAPLEIGARVDAGSGMPLVVDLVAGTPVVLAMEEVIEPHLVERRRGRVRRQVAADSLRLLVGTGHHGRGVPAHDAPDAPLHLLVAREPRLLFGGDGVDVVGRHHRGKSDLLRARPLQHPRDQVARPRLARHRDDRVEGLQPLRGLVGVDVGQLRRHPVEVHPPSLPLPPRTAGGPSTPTSSEPPYLSGQYCSSRISLSEKPRRSMIPRALAIICGCPQR